MALLDRFGRRWESGQLQLPDRGKMVRRFRLDVHDALHARRRIDVPVDDVELRMRKRLGANPPTSLHIEVLEGTPIPHPGRFSTPMPADQAS